MSDDLLIMTRRGLYCPHGDFHIDPNGPVERALITHAHADHARWGAGEYWALHDSIPVMQKRLGEKIVVKGVDHGESMALGDARVSFHPAGHIRGSAQIRIQAGSQIWVATGDFKREPDPTCEPFEVVPCDVLVTEATFAMPVYRWQPTHIVIDEIHDWWQGNATQGRTSVLFCYALGKAQRIMAELLRHTDQTLWLHGATRPLTDIYRRQGVALPPTRPVSEAEKGYDFAGDLVLAPPSAAGTRWMRRFTDPSTGFTSGWMRIRGNRRRRGYDRGFILSDHADWPGLLRTVRDSGAERVIAMHGRIDALVQYLNEQGLDATGFEVSDQGDGS